MVKIPDFMPFLVSKLAKPVKTLPLALWELAKTVKTGQND